MINISQGSGDPLIAKFREMLDTGDFYITTSIEINVREQQSIDLDVEVTKETDHRRWPGRNGRLRLSLEKAKELNKFLLDAIKQIEDYNEYARQQDTPKSK